jgi:hypothetical protein
MAYIRVDKEQPNDTRLFDLADALAKHWQVVYGGNNDLTELENRHVLRHAALGALVTLWAYADTHIRSDNSLPVTLSGLAAIVTLPVTMLEEFPACWLTEREDGLIELPGYCEKNGITGRDIRKQNADHEREQSRLRKQRQRERERHGKNGRDTQRDTPRDMSRGHADTGTGTGPLPLDHTKTGTVSHRAAPLAAAGEAAATPRKSFGDDFRDRFGTDPRIKAADAPAGHGRKP